MNSHSTTATHERFTYKNRACLSGYDDGTTRHECDLPEGHTSRCMCGQCGRYFG